MCSRSFTRLMDKGPWDWAKCKTLPRPPPLQPPPPHWVGGAWARRRNGNCWGRRQPAGARTRHAPGPPSRPAAGAAALPAKDSRQNRLDVAGDRIQRRAGGRCCPAEAIHRTPWGHRHCRCRRRRLTKPCPYKKCKCRLIVSIQRTNTRLKWKGSVGRVVVRWFMHESEKPSAESQQHKKHQTETHSIK